MSTDMQGKVVVITGATSGIGQVTSECLAGMGARIVQIARSRERGEAAMQRLRQSGPGASHTIHYADLSRLSEMKRVGAEIAAAEPRIDVLINNAGALFPQREVTEDGLEKTFALNHMSYFVLTALLRERLLAPARIVNVASNAHRRYALDFNDLQSSKDYGGFKAYCRSKLCNVLFTRELARSLKDSGVTANSLHPGFVDTRWGAGSGGLMGIGLGVAKRLFALTPEQGAETIIFLASSPDVTNVSGEYFAKCKVEAPSAAGQDDAAAKRLWQESLRLAGLPAAATAGA